jgi:DnaJ-class molecular chaperone
MDNSSNNLNHYDILGLSCDATEKEIRRSYIELARSLHPDKNKFGTQLFKRINEAYEVLSDPITRKQYDRFGPTARQTEQQQQQQQPSSSSSGESSKERSESQTKKEKKSKQRQQHKSSSSTSSSSSSSSSSSKKKFLIAITCMVCDSIVDKDFYEAPCCGALCCVECATSGFKCRNKSCTSPQTLNNDKHHPNRHNSKNKNKNPCWTKSSKFINKQIDNVTMTHICGKRIDIDEVKKHELICPKLNFACIKCFGRGKYLTIEGEEIQCNACNGRKVLVGLDWTKCFKCNGRGAYDSILKTVINCSTCEEKGALNGKWTMCFKCQGAGAYDTDNEGRSSCEICNCAGTFKGFNVLECSACKGCGCVACNWKGYLPCMCGDSCKGHSNQYTKRYHECIPPQYCYESDTSSDL